MELLRPGGPLVISKQDAVESRMPQHVVKDGVPVPVTHDGRRELLQVLISCRRQLMQLQRISATQGTESAPGLAAQGKRVAGLLGASLKQFVTRAAAVAAEIGNQDALASLFAVRGRNLLCKIPNLIGEIDPIEMLHKAVAFEKVVCVKMILDNYPDSGLLHRLTRDGTPMHLAAFTGNPDMIQLLIDAGAPIDASSSSFDIYSESASAKVRPITEISVANVPWKHQSRLQEYTPTDIFHDFCPYKHQEEYANQARCAVLLDGHQGSRHGSGALGSQLVYWDPITGDQIPRDREKARAMLHAAMADEITPDAIANV